MGTVLASIGIPMLMNALTGKGLHVEKSRPKRSLPVSVPPKRPKQGKGKNARMMSYYPPPFIVSWDGMVGLGIKKKATKKKSKKGKGLLLGKNSPFNNIPILGAIL